LQRAIRKYGDDGFTATVLMIANDWAYLRDMEIRAIVAFKTAFPAGYNLTLGGEGIQCIQRTAEQRAKQSERSKALAALGGNLPGRTGNSFSLGYRHTDEARRKIAAAATGATFTPERCAAISAARTGLKYKGSPCSDERREKIRAAQIGRPLSEEHRAALKGRHKGKPWSAARRAAQKEK